MPIAPSSVIRADSGTSPSRRLGKDIPYYGMQTLLVLYMTRQLLLPGHVENIAGFAAFAR